MIYSSKMNNFIGNRTNIFELDNFVIKRKLVKLATTYCTNSRKLKDSVVFLEHEGNKTCF